MTQAVMEFDAAPQQGPPDRPRCPECSRFYSPPDPCTFCVNEKRRQERRQLEAHRRAEAERRRDERAKQFRRARLAILDRHVRRFLANSAAWRRGDPDAIPPWEFPDPEMPR